MIFLTYLKTGKSLIKDFYMDELGKFSSILNFIIKHRKEQEEEIKGKKTQKI